MITTTLGPMEESLLIKREGVVDNENERTATIEYCVVGCPGTAHMTKKPDSPSHFCSNHVHRSVHVTVKKIEAADGVAAGF